ncbi:Cytochrome P450 4F4 [Trichoplax sp. H2]|nr:Cytochrome P450 4F4 [Trichoplax sp. H2]|eukprot:RDD36935.1 Cytochrome P450 4F4 [Trichoplax sp. H2]
MQGPKPHWITGNVSDFDGSFSQSLLKIDRQYSRKYALYYGIWHPVLAINHPDTIRMALKKPFSKDTDAMKYVRDWTGDGILTSNGALWARNRRLLTPAFHFDVLRSYVSIYNECTDILIEKWKNNCGKCIEIFDDMSRLTFDVLLRCAFSANLNLQTSEKRHPFLLATDENSYIVEERFVNLIYSITSTFKLTAKGRQYFKNTEFSRKFAKEILMDRRKQIQTGQADTSNKKYLDFLDIMLQAKDSSGNGLTDDEIVAEAITFLFAGHDTTASTISFALFSLAKHPEYQQKIREEYEQVLNGKDELSWGDLAGLQFTAMCIKETLRIHPPVCILGRGLCEDTEIDGQVFPKGLELELQLYCIHHNPEFWPDPWTFNPLRFTQEEINKRDPYTFFPFALGSRNCIGQNFAMNEAKVTLAKLVHRFEFSEAENRPLDHLISSVLRNVGGTWVQLKDRNP